VADVLASEPSAVLVVAGAEDSARLVTALRRPGLAVRSSAGRAGTATFRHRGGDGSGRRALPAAVRSLPADPFVQTFLHECGHLPDYRAAHTYDAVQLVIAAIRKSGLNRARVRDALCEVVPWSGATARSTGRLGSNTRTVPLGEISQGRPQAASPRPGPSASLPHSTRP